MIDISLKGVLLQLPAGTAPRAGMPCLVNLPLASGEEAIAMAGELAHVENGHAGVLCRSIRRAAESCLKMFWSSCSQI